MSTLTLNTLLKSLNAVSNPAPLVDVKWDLLASEQLTTYLIDPLAMSVANIRIHGRFGISRATDVTQDDLDRANVIRKYFSKKYFLKAIKDGAPLTKYRSAVLKFLETTGTWKLSAQDDGMVVKLPCFYEEDQIMDEFRKTMIVDQEYYTNSDTVTKELTYLKSTLRWTKTKKTLYWFKDQDNLLYSYSSDYDNSLNALFEEKIKQPITPNFSYSVKWSDDIWFNDITKFKFLKETDA